MSDLLYSETEDELRSAVRSLLTDRCDAAQVIARAESDQPHDHDLWKTLAADMGLAGLLVPESLGGQGASARETAVVLEELGRFVAPVPYLSSAVIATEALLGCGSPAADELLKGLASGRSIGVLALPLSTAPSTSYVQVDEADGRLTGRIAAVADAAAADVLLVVAGSGLYAVDTTAEGVSVSARTPLDLTRPLSVVTLESAPGRLLAADAGAAVRRGLTAGAALLASEQLGLADWCLTETVAYLKTRHQFNRPVGSFQSVKHRLAELWLETVHARAAARNAADALATGSEDAPLAAALAQAYCAPVAVHAAEEALQMHGGIGMTWEHPVHLYLKRAKSDAIALGAAGVHQEAVAELVDLQAP
ncbi:acyl-CoA/acyl-ACP dehydrogenase [Streptomyces sp. TRM66268-LWL]|uniref:Acyl-CoA/acyl-ACP dehydrogenase n=1 Tax=Streptomyces polyasparticus TaxID=2767826 RepID=A0ABR7SST7_9ACTN|nr:acyl-CoA dehydrogenase family protein [Streptomyces polyasparticus]MBC9717353.1 acyl-CoA/acyl-ACP dehydrogenase [Streptomyces polyasparticus]